MQGGIFLRKMPLGSIDFALHQLENRRSLSNATFYCSSNSIT
jgi:hypothetical protein